MKLLTYLTSSKIKYYLCKSKLQSRIIITLVMKYLTGN